MIASLTIHDHKSYCGPHDSIICQEMTAKYIKTISGFPLAAVSSVFRRWYSGWDTREYSSHRTRIAWVEPGNSKRSFSIRSALNCLHESGSLFGRRETHSVFTFEIVKEPEYNLSTTTEKEAAWMGILRTALYCCLSKDDMAQGDSENIKT